MQKTNLYELIASERLELLMQQLGVAKEYRAASDYERFSLLLYQLPRLPYHPFSRGLSEYLRSQLGVSFELIPQNAALIWRSVAEQLRFKRVEPFLPVSRPLQERPRELLALPSLLFEKSFFDGGLLLNAPVPSHKEWEAFGERLFRKALEEGKTGASFLLSSRFEFLSPNPYHVSLALSDATLDRSGSQLLQAQAVRMLYSLCQRHGLPLLLITECEPLRIKPLLEYLYARMGRAELLWVPSLADRACLPSCISKPPFTELRPVLRERDLPRDALLEVLCILAPEYPIGRLCLLR